MTEPIAAPAAVRASASFGSFWIAIMAAMMLPGRGRAGLQARHELTPSNRSAVGAAASASSRGLPSGSLRRFEHGLMLVLLTLGVKSVAWMSLVAAVVFVQKLVPEQWVVDVPPALAIGASES